MRGVILGLSFFLCVGSALSRSLFFTILFISLFVMWDIYLLFIVVETKTSKKGVKTTVKESK